MRVVILAAYTEDVESAISIKQALSEMGQQITLVSEGEIEAVVIEMESTVDNLLSNLRQLRG